jgi:general secretion pathway protein D
VALEVSDSQDAGRTNAGTTLVRVKTSNASTTLRLKNGETQILAGLIRNDHLANADQVPGLGAIPGVGRLFGQHDDNWKKRELVLSITPRIVRSTPYMAPHLLEYTSGTEGSLRARPLSLQGGDAERAVVLAAPPGTAGPAAPATPPTAAPVQGRAVAAPVAAPSAAPSGSPAASIAAAPGALAVVMQGANRLKVGEETTVNLLVKSEQPLVSAALQIGFDPKAVKILEVTEGSLLNEDGVKTTFSARVDEGAGRVFIGVARDGGTGASGEGTLVQLRVQGVAPAQAAPLKVVLFSAIGPGNRIQPAPAPAALDLAVEF